MTTKELAKKIKKYREDLDLTQADLADKVGLERATITQIEAGNRDITSLELGKFAKVFNVSVDDILSENESEETLPKSSAINIPEFNREKFEQVLLYILEKCGARPNVGETVLYKLLYFADFNFYELYEEFLTGASYRKIQHGPAPCEITDVIKEMIEQKKLKKVVTEYFGKPQKKYLPLVEPDLSKFSASEKEVIDQVIMGLSGLNASSISEHSHKDVPWEITKEKEIINYDSVFYRTPPYSIRSYAEK